MYKNPLVQMNFKLVTKLLQNLQTNQPFCEYRHFLSDTGFIHFELTKNSLTIPWHFHDTNSNFPDSIGAENFMNLTTKKQQKKQKKKKNKYIGIKHSSFIRLKCIPRHFCKISSFPDISQNSLRMSWSWKNLNFPDISLTCMNPVTAALK